MFLINPQSLNIQTYCKQKVLSFSFLRPLCQIALFWPRWRLVLLTRETLKRLLLQGSTVILEYRSL